MPNEPKSGLGVIEIETGMILEVAITSCGSTLYLSVGPFYCFI